MSAPLFPKIPQALRSLAEGCAWTRAADGLSTADVFELRRPDGPRMFLKVEAAGDFAELPGEAARLRWLRATDVPCPEPLGFVSEGGRHWLLMTALTGRDLAVRTDMTPQDVAQVAADALKRLHSLEVGECPFDAGIEQRLASARARVEAGLVDEDDFDDANAGQTAQALFARLMATRPSAEDLVVAHGDATPPNLLAEGDRFTGFIDLGRLGVADRRQDLALMARDLAADFGEACAAAFLQAYGGGDIDPEALAWFRLLDEFF